MNPEIIHSKVRNNCPIRIHLPTVDQRNLHDTEFQGQSAVMKSCNAECLSQRQITTLCIKNMVSLRCKLVVKAVLERMGLQFSHLEIGRVEITDHFTQKTRDRLRAELLKFGLELLDDERAILVERIKNVIVEMVHYTDELPDVKFSVYLSEKLKDAFSYAYLSALFTEVTGTTIKHFIILHKIERAKEMLVYDNELTLSEIAWQLHYSSVAHLSNQFRKVTGLTPSHFKNMKHKRLTALEDL